jgi:hypothetical protein
MYADVPTRIGSLLVHMRRILRATEKLLLFAPVLTAVTIQNFWVPICRNRQTGNPGVRTFLPPISFPIKYCQYWSPAPAAQDAARLL